MGLGREVADAYIEVHGDLSKFRKDLEGAKGKMEELAKKNAKSFTDAWDAQAANDFKRKWADTVQAMYSGEKLDFNRLIKSFDPTDLDAAEQKVKDFLANMSRRQKLTGENYKATKKALLDTIEAMRLEEKQAAAILEVEKELGEMREKQNRALEERAAIMDEAIKDNKAWARSFEGLRKNSAIAQIEDDFKKLAKVMDSADVSKFMRGMSGFDEVRDRVKAVTDQMLIQRRITQENADQLHRNVEAFITQQEELGRIEAANAAADSRAKAAALDAARRLREEQDRYRASLDGMVQAAHFKRLERDFTQLAVAMESNDWSAIARGHESLTAMHARTLEVATAMRDAGRIGDQEFARISARVAEVRDNAALFNIHLRQGRTEAQGLEIDFRALSQRVLELGDRFRGTFSHLKGLAGLNVLGDLVRKGLEFAQNIDRAALAMARTTLSAGSLSSLIGTAVAGMITVGSDALKAANVGILAPAFLTAFGIQVGVLVAAFKDMKTVLKDLGPQFSALQDSISAAFWKQAEAPIRNLVDSLMPTLKTQLQNTATELGGMFAALSDGFRKHATPQRVEGMFKKMNAAIKTAQAAMEPMASALVTLGEVGSDYFGRFAEWIVDLSTQFDDFITAAAKDGRLKRWIDEGIEAVKDLGRVAGGITEIFGAINEAATRAGIGGLAEFRKSIEDIADFMQGDRFQGTMTTLFEGMKLAVQGIGQGIKDLGPAIESIALEIKQSLENIGTAVGGIITIIAGVLSNPLVQDGIVNFTQGIEDAIKALEPAVKPFSDSLGKMLTNLGDIVVSIAEIVTAFTVTLMPVIDQIGDEFMKLADPLKDSVINAIAVARPVLESLNKNVVAPLVQAFRVHLLPAIDGFVQKLGPFLSKIAEDLGPILTNLAKDVLPPLLKGAGELLKPLGALFDLFSPLLEDIIKGVGEAFGELAKAIEEFNKWADPAYVLMGKIADKMREIDDFKPKSGNPYADLATKFSVAAILADPAVASFAIFFGKLTKGWTDSLSGFLSSLNLLNPETWKLNLVEFAANLPSWMFEGFDMAEFATNVGLWFHDNIYTPLKDGWLALLMKIATIFVGGGEEESGAGGGIGTMSKGGKITPEMLGVGAPEEGWLEETFNTVIEGITTFFTNIGTNIALFGEQVKTNWDNFWGGLGTKVEEIWNGMTTWITTKTTEIQTNIGMFIETVRLNWTNFWDGFGRKVNEIWTGITTWITTKATEIRTNIDTFITTVRTNWDNFWTTVRNKATETWNGVTTWITTKVNEIRTNIDTFITTVRTNWNNFWTGVRNKVTETWNGIRSWITTKVGEIRSNIESFMNGVKSNWEGGWNAVKTTVTTAWENMKRTVSDSGNNIVEFVKGLPGKIEGALGGLGGLLTGAGNAIMEGLKNGIEGGFEAVKSVVGGIAGWIRDNKGPISYDRVLLIPAGEAIMDGLEKGLLNRMAPLADTLHSITQTLTDTVTDGFARSKMYLAGAEAALGLADGLKSRSSALQGALGDLTPTAGLSISGTGGVGVPTPVGNTTIVNVAEGAIPISTPAENPRLVASMVIDEFASTVSKF